MSMFSKLLKPLGKDLRKLGKVPIIGRLVKPLAPVLGTVLGPVGAAVGAVGAAVGAGRKLHGNKSRKGGKRAGSGPSITPRKPGPYPTVYDAAGNAYYDASGGGPGAPPPVPGMEASVIGDLGDALGNMLGGGYQTGRAAAESLVGPAGGGGGIPTRHGVLQGKMAPSVKVRRVHKCLAGYALARDGYCYPKAMLPRWARKWRPEPKPVLSHSTVKAIRKAEHARKRLVKLTKEAGAHASLKAPSPHRALPPGRKRR